MMARFLPPSIQCFPRSSWLLGEKRNWGGSVTGNWTREENKLFENALAEFDRDTPDRWEKVASYIPGKTARDVESHYRNLLEDVSKIEAGRFPCPGYDPSSFSREWDDNCGFEAMTQPFCIGRKRSGASCASDQERKKGIPWTEEEHKRFLLGLRKYGKGDWRNISRNFVITRNPTQVASHAQKYFIRLNSGGKDKRRSSIHDITTANLPDNRPSSPSQLPFLSTQFISVPSSYSSIQDLNQPDGATVNEKGYGDESLGISYKAALLMGQFGHFNNIDFCHTYSVICRHSIYLTSGPLTGWLL
ncbi:hypothetical protein ZIOFF_058137 [Zingiber officinale]|uniref:Transcription factor MYBS1 n=1 Tax=Zingiber officinale TaxID=94328 RepID=A0A8J5KLL7_ZINOF|nr:hypothetical protein ZIOFF_058137 [Zingiber officinale]WLQ69682.1 MYB protein [Zingiber officinale]